MPDRFLAIQLVARASGPNTPRHTEGSSQVIPSPCLRHAQQSHIQSHIPVIACQSRPRRITPVLPALVVGLSRGIGFGFVGADVLYDDIPNLVALHQFGLVDTLPWFTSLVILFECFTFILNSTQRKQPGQGSFDSDAPRFDIMPICV